MSRKNPLSHHPKLIVGGHVHDYPLDQWPHFNDVPLSYLGQYTDHHKNVYFIFLDGPKNEVDQSWQAEGGSNAVLWVSDGIVDNVDWITLLPISEPLERLTEAYDVPIPEEPEWLQGDEDQEGYDFAGQIDSDLDDVLNIGDAHGMAYLFINEDAQAGRLIWQS